MDNIFHNCFTSLKFLPNKWFQAESEAQDIIAKTLIDQQELEYKNQRVLRVLLSGCIIQRDFYTIREF